MSEKNATSTVRTHVLGLRGDVHVQRIEDKLTPGISDMNVCWRPADSVDSIEFWMEGKFLKSLPARDDTLVRFGNKGEMRLVHQRNWMQARSKVGGHCFWWVRVADHGWYLFDNRYHLLVDGIEKRQLLAERLFPSAKEMVQEIAACLHEGVT